jgi:hypothetical protein
MLASLAVRAVRSDFNFPYTVSDRVAGPLRACGPNVVRRYGARARIGSFQTQHNWGILYLAGPNRQRRLNEQ